ncbi:MAG: U32 family peptidase, partial [Clostridium sp.]|nr:U32 family peptidase [Clostridium sp.]
NGRSANRGECAQMCRMAYDLVDDRGNVLIANKHLLSLRDLCRLGDLEALARAGVSSFKIEGRLKDAAYVKTVVSAYRKALDKIIADHPAEYCRASQGRSITSISADVSKAFNRGFTPYFLNGAPAHLLSNGGASPKWIGQPVGKALRMAGKAIVATLDAELNNGDGLGYFDRSGAFRGFRLNKVEGDRLFPASPVDIQSGAPLYRNADVKLAAVLAADRPQRLIDINMSLDLLPGRLALAIDDGGAHHCVATIPCDADKAKTDQKEARARALSKLGGTPFALASLSDNVPADAFIPASVLASLRRQAIDLFTLTILTTHPLGQAPKPAQDPPKAPKRLTYHDNVANSLARQFYLDSDAESIDPAFELSAPNADPAPYAPKADPSSKPSAKEAGTVVMTTKYCLRRELGACLRLSGAKKLPTTLFLKNKAATYRLTFDCPNCQMRLLLPK